MSVGKTKWTGGQYSLCRALLGLYLFTHFGALIPWGTEVFSSAGVLPDASASPLLVAFPNVLALVDSPVFVGFLLASATLASLLFASGRFDRIAALYVWYLLA